MFRVRVQMRVRDKVMHGYIKSRAGRNQCNTSVRGWIRHS